MKNYKYWFRAFVFVTLLGFSSIGCVTKNLWRTGVISEHYSETIISFYANKQKEQLVFIGKKYHYLFNKNSYDFIDFLDKREFLNISQKDLRVTSSVSFDDNNRVMTYIYVNLKKEHLSSNQISYLTSHKFRETFRPPHIGKEYRDKRELLGYSRNYTIVGRRYLANNEVNNKVLKLKYPMNLNIETFRKEKDVSLYKVLMTPLAVTADAGLVLAGAVILPIIWITK